MMQPEARPLPPPTRDIFYAAKSEDLGLLIKILGEGADVNATEEDDLTPLHWAALKGNIGMTRYLLAKGATIEAVTQKEGNTPLHWACVGGHLKVVHFLITHGADRNKLDKRGYNAFHHAIQYNHVLIAHYLLEGGYSMAETTDNEGHTPLMWATYFNHESAIRYLLKQHKVDVDARDNTGFTALHWAASRGHSNAIHILLKNGSNQNARDNSNLTPFQVAMNKGNKRVAAILESERAAGPYLSQNQINYFWTIFAFLMVQIIFWSFAYLKFWQFSLFFAILFFGGEKILGNLKVGHHVQNPANCSAMLSGYFISAYVYLYTLFPGTLQEWPILTMFFLVLNFVFFPLYLWLIFSDPGYLPRGKEEWEAFVRELDEDGPLTQFCLTCMVRRPLRSKHCSACDRCVARFDHHCIWINNCVGANNIVKFILMLILLIFNHSIFIFFAFTSLEDPGDRNMIKTLAFHYVHQPFIGISNLNST
eukprot:TRINITY_DN2182_c0_g1_i2.p1 TRINITY_DN2182_c0_g1~~TRINITY_DN2182_c0_g1_i2.p1  ORF type:complete len:479 (-),score=121.60 TRINITY_DN2182_c0_g1_i2:343-1779(-)